MSKAIIRAAWLAGNNDRLNGRSRNIRFENDDLAEAYALGLAGLVLS